MHVLSAPCPHGTPQVKKTWSKNGAGFTYGLCTSAFFIMCPFLLLTGIVLTGNKHHTSTFEASPRGVWTKSCKWYYCYCSPCLVLTLLHAYWIPNSHRQTIVLQNPGPGITPFCLPPSHPPAATNAFVATYVLAFISAVFDLILAVTMVTNRKSFGGAQSEQWGQAGSTGSSGGSCSFRRMPCCPAAPLPPYNSTISLPCLYLPCSNGGRAGAV